MSRPPPTSTLTAPIFPYTPLFRSVGIGRRAELARPVRFGQMSAGEQIDEVEVGRVGEHTPTEPPEREDDEFAVGDAAVRGDEFRDRRVGEPLQRRLGELRIAARDGERGGRSEEHTSELQSLMRISYAVFCLKKNKKSNNPTLTRITNAHRQHT